MVLFAGETHTHTHTQSKSHTHSFYTSANIVDDFNHYNMLRTQTHPQGANQLLPSSHLHTSVHTHIQAKPTSFQCSFFSQSHFWVMCVCVCVCVCVLRRMLLASAESLKLQSPMMCGCGFGDQCLSSQEGEILFCWDWHMSKLLVCPSPAPSIKICKAEAPNLKRWSYISISKQNSCLFKLLAVYEQFYLCCAQ